MIQWKARYRCAFDEPKGAPPPREMAIRTKKPKMTGVRAAIIKVISIYREMEYGLSSIEVQKLAYFLGKAGQALDLEFVKQSFGPYSDKLRHVQKALDGHYILGVGDFAEEADIAVAPGAKKELCLTILLGAAFYSFPSGGGFFVNLQKFGEHRIRIHFKAPQLSQRPSSMDAHCCAGIPYADPKLYLKSRTCFGDLPKVSHLGSALPNVQTFRLATFRR